VPGKTEVVLHHFGNDYYFDKVWIQGKDYGYEFPLPQDARSRENERGAAVTVAAKYENATREATAAAPEPPAATAESAELHQPVTTEQLSQPQPARHRLASRSGLKSRLRLAPLPGPMHQARKMDR
jgi:hypothetical protein